MTGFLLEDPPQLLILGVLDSDLVLISNDSNSSSDSILRTGGPNRMFRLTARRALRFRVMRVIRFVTQSEWQKAGTAERVRRNPSKTRHEEDAAADAHGEEVKIKEQL